MRFPTAHDIARLPPEKYRAIGFSSQKVRALLDLAGAIVRQELDLEFIAEEDDSVVRQRLLELRGVGRWTSEYVLLRGLGRLNVFPGDDVGAQKRLARWLGRSRRLDYAGVCRAVKRWHPYAGRCISTSCSTGYRRPEPWIAILNLRRSCPSLKPGDHVSGRVDGRSTMSSAPHNDNRHRRPHSSPMAAAFLEFDLTRELEQLHGEPEWSSGRNAKTLVKYDDFRVVLTALKAHARLPEHQTKGRISIQTIAGHIWCERKVGHSICPQAACSHSTGTCLMTLRLFMTARFSLRLRGLMETDRGSADQASGEESGATRSYGTVPFWRWTTTARSRATTVRMHPCSVLSRTRGGAI